MPRCPSAPASSHRCSDAQGDPRCTPEASNANSAWAVKPTEAESKRGGARTRTLTSWLFYALLFLQYADLHSTVTASTLQFERNRFMVWLCQWMTPVSTVFAVKACSLVLLLALYRAWKTMTGNDDWPWLVCVGTIFLVYLAIVINNYAAR